MFFFILMIFASEFKIKEFPVIYNNKKIVFKKVLDLDNSITYNLSKLSPIWCDKGYKKDFSKDFSFDLYLNCYGFKKEIFNEFKPIDIKKEILETYELKADINPFKIYYYIKKFYFKNNICLNNDRGNYWLLSYLKVNDFNLIIESAIKEFRSLNQEELKALYEFFISSFTSSCDKYLFYYQAHLYGFYDVEILFNQKYWLN